MGFERSRINVDAWVSDWNDRVVRQFQTSRVDDDLKGIGNRAVPVRVVVGAGQGLFVPHFAAQETVKISVYVSLGSFPSKLCKLPCRTDYITILTDVECFGNTVPYSLYGIVVAPSTFVARLRVDL